MEDWTEEQARAYLPRLRGLLAILRNATTMAVRVRTNGHGSLRAAGVEGGRAQHPSAPEGAPEEALPDVTPEEALAELEDRGIVLRDLERGLVDFPSRHPSGRTVLLCWQRGEDDLGWWHLPEEGFAGRRPLPLPPQL